MMKRLIAPICFCVLLVFSCTKDKLEIEAPPEPVDTTTVSDTDTVVVDTCKFTTHIQPIIDANCVGCHGSGSSDGDFTSYSGIFAKIDNSGPFENRVLILKDMPMGGSLTQSEIDLIQCWLDNGAENN